MIELLLDNKQAVLRDNASIKLTRENVYFTKSGSYTYDIDLPLDRPENRAIMGCINRKDVSAGYREFHAVLRVDNQVLLDGKAVIHQVTDSFAKLQLLGGNAEMNFYTRGAEVYVDELDLGDWFSLMNWSPEPRHYKGNAFLLLDQEHNAIFPQDYSHPQAFTEWMPRWWANMEGTDSNNATDKGVMFPVINESASYREGTNNAEANNLEGGGVIVNGYILREYQEDTDVPHLYYPEFRYSWPNGEQTAVPQVIPSFQPMLVMMIVKVMQAAGYPMEEDSEIKLLSNPLIRHIFIVTANNRLELNKALPHWTVNEFVTQVEHLLGCVIEVDESTKRSRVIFRKDYWDDEAVTVIDRAVDEYSVEIDKNETTDISNGNVAFSDTPDGYTHVSEDILEAVEVDKTRFPTIASMSSALARGTVTREDKAKIFEAQGHHFIVTGSEGAYEFKEVNQLRMLQRNMDKRDADIELKIVPCPITKWDCPYVTTSKIWNATKNKYEYKDSVRGSVPVDVFTRPDIAHIGTDSVSTDDTIDIEALIEGEQDIEKAEEKADLMYIGIVPRDCTYQWADIRFYWPRPVSWHQWRVTAGGIDAGNTIHQKEFLELNHTTDDPEEKNLFDLSMDASQVIDTTVKHVIKFMGRRVMNPGGIFLIQGQRFACEKLEFTISSDGVSPLVTGYFYRLS